MRFIISFVDHETCNGFELQKNTRHVFTIALKIDVTLDAQLRNNPDKSIQFIFGTIIN